MKKNLKTLILSGIILASCSDDDTAAVDNNPVVESTTTEQTIQTTFTSMKISGKVTVSGNQEITARGVCWSESPNPTVDDSRTTENNNIFTSNIQNLTANTAYHFRIYAVTQGRTFYSDEFTYSTSGFAGSTWDFHVIYNEDISWHADVIFNEDGTAVYDEPDCPGCYTSYGTWSLDGNNLHYDMDNTDQDQAYVFDGIISENTMSGTFNFGNDIKNWTAVLIE